MNAVTHGTVDAAGMTRAEVMQLTPEEQFDLFGERYERVQELMTGAQLQISDGEWRWLAEAFVPTAGVFGLNPPPGADFENSYFLESTRSIRMPGAAGAREDLDPMIAYFESQNWDTTVSSRGSDFVVRAETGDGYQVSYTVQSNGQYNLNVYSYVFWGDSNTLLDTVVGRIPNDTSDSPTLTVPGGFVPFPKWSDPVIPDE
ncbi:hypothetical protein [Glaciibacter psychrotolerans]|uniref:Uncharacterized protein n=1 Tax=Glaciibacter psychrotolerans TaxID=670054 RepID=A0A7Z0EHJ8_9MICO|nr:hypothetical protein [Leifsonia psychrotolerans]NYJ21047.1 hypothetical protein [Leifsonia psychrotolerans]